MKRFWRAVLMRAAIQWLSPWTVVAGVLVWGMWHLLPSAQTAAYNVSLTAYNANQAIATLNDTLVGLNAPCKDFQGDWICGPIPQLSQTEKNIGILAARSAQQVQQTATLVTATATTLTTVGQSVQRTADSLTKTGDAATQTVQQAKTDLQTLNGSIAAVTPLVSHSDAAVSDLDAFLKSQAVTGSAENVQAITKDWALMSADLHIYTHPILNPDPCKNAKCKWGRVLGKIAGYAGLAANGVSIADRFSPIPVRLVH